MDRRRFLQRALVATAGGAVSSQLPIRAVNARMVGAIGSSPYGPLRGEPDENGLLLPEGFTSRIVGVAGHPVEGTEHRWHAFPDGAATFPTEDGGWIYVCNSEVFRFLTPEPEGGVSAVRFDAGGAIVDAYPILEGSHSNCAGGPTPWGTWLSCEEAVDEQGLVYECDPTGRRPAVAHEAMGRWAHEAVAVDPVSETLYLTQDNPTGLLYRFTPTAYPDLSAGLLEACVVAGDGSVSWREVPDPSGTTAPTREQVPEATVFPGGEGIWYHDDWVYFTTKLDHTVHAIDLRAQRYAVVWRGDPGGLGVEGAVLSHVDNLTVDAGSGDLFIAEDGGSMEVVVISAEGVVAPFVRIAGSEHEGSEVTGPCFSPRRDRLYFSSQRGPSGVPLREVIPGFPGDGAGGGITYEVTGPFRGVLKELPRNRVPPSTVPPPVTVLDRAAPAVVEARGPDPVVGGVGAAVVVAAAAGAIRFRRRGERVLAPEPDSPGPVGGS
jgi:hypothetical protein